MSLTYEKHEVRRYRRGETNYTVVAGGDGTRCCPESTQQPLPTSVWMENTLSTSRTADNHRVMKWVKGAKEGIVVAGGRGKGNDLTQLSSASRSADRCDRQRLRGRLVESSIDALVSWGDTGHCRGGWKRRGKRCKSVQLSYLVCPSIVMVISMSLTVQESVECNAFHLRRTEIKKHSLVSLSFSE